MPTPSRRAFLSGVAASVAALPARAASPMGPRIIEARPGKAVIGPAGETDILGFDGASPGPVLRYKQGEELLVRFVNKLDQPASIHWHGMRGDNAMDGVAPLTQAAVAPGASFDYRRRLTEPGLFCYRPSVYGRTPELMGRGLKGLIVVDEPETLPADHDLLLVLDDWRLDAQGKIAGAFNDPGEARGAGRIGPLLAVNGKAAPATREFAGNSRVRLRLANLANARIMILTFDGVQPFVVAIDSQPCDAFEPVKKSIPVAPGARFEVIFDMPATEGGKARLLLHGQDGAADQELLVAASKGARPEKKGLIYGLPHNPGLPAEIRLNNARKVDLVIDAPAGGAGPGWTINGIATKGYEGAPLFRVPRGTPVTLGYVNKSKVPLAMHVHGHAMRLLHDLDDGWEPYWRNGVIVPAGRTKHVSFIADSPGKWAIHDDILEHEAAGLATWFEAF
ncbi:MAG: copper oxidase [Methylocystis sp.]|nr:MAG: copper oxidase [Methylocystis sp.]